MTARRSNLQRAFGRFLPLHLFEIRPACRSFGDAWFGRTQYPLPFEVVEQRQQVWCGNDLDLACPCRFCTLHCRADKPHLPPRSMERCKQYARGSGNPPIEAEFANDDIMRKRFGIDQTHGRQQRHRDRQVVMRSFLGQVSRREVDSDPFGRQRKPESRDGGAHALAAFCHRLVRQANH